METHNLILVKEFCTHNEIEMSFIDELQDMGLIEIVSFDNGKYLDPHQLKDLEKLARLHYELDINMEGLDVVFQLLNRISNLERELKNAQNKLRFYS